MHKFHQRITCLESQHAGMTWHSATPPLRIWKGDKWVGPQSGKAYVANVQARKWLHEDLDAVAFPEDTVVFD